MHTPFYLSKSGHLFSAVFIAAVVLFLLSLLAYWYSRTRKFKRFDYVKEPMLQQERYLQCPPPSEHQVLFVDFSPQASDLIDLASEIWRINNRIYKVADDLSEIQKRGLESSAQKLMRYLDKFDIKVVDHTNEKYNEGMNVDVLSFEKDIHTRVPFIRETIEPSISCRGQVVRKGKVIVVTD